MMANTAGMIVLGSLLVRGAEAGGYCGGFDLDDAGQASQCLSDDNSRNGALHIHAAPSLAEGSCGEQPPRPALLKMA